MRTDERIWADRLLSMPRGERDACASIGAIMLVHECLNLGFVPLFLQAKVPRSRSNEQRTSMRGLASLQPPSVADESATSWQALEMGIDTLSPEVTVSFNNSTARSCLISLLSGPSSGNSRQCWW
jgi:hypothetical protein